MQINYADEFRKDLVEFRDITRKFYNKEISVADYKHFSGAFGSYAQRGGDTGMLRLRICGGRVTKEYLKFIIDSTEKHSINHVHITTCQSIQFHNLNAEVICELIEEAWDHGFITRGGGGDYPRNVMMTPLAGVEKGEYFDMTPYAEAAGDYLLSFIKTVKLPRKLKVCFSGTPENWPHATFRDMGFVATPEKTFDVYIAGGLGPNPKLGVRVAENVAPEKILYYIKAMVNTFTTYGNYEKRTMARTRYMQDSLGGPENLKKAYQEKLEEVLQTEKLDIDVKSCETSKKGTDETIENSRVTQQKQPGLYAVSYHPIGGNPAPSKLREIYDAMKDMDDVEIRLTPNEGLFFINCTAGESQKLIDITDDGASNLFETSVACIGNRICQVGARDSQQLLGFLINSIAPFNFADGVLPRVRISGCPSSCSAHQIAPIGFRGAAKKTADGVQPAFAVFEGGCDNLGQEKFGNDVATMVIDDIPKFLIELGQTISADNSTFEAWIQTNHDKFVEIAKKYD